MKPQRWVDAFNVIHLIPEIVELLGEYPEEARERFLRMLLPLAASGGEIWTVVFDGPRGGRQLGPGPIEVVFAPSADSWIVSHLRSHPQPSSVTVVSSDEKDICRSARQLGARVISSREFVASIRRRRERAYTPRPVSEKPESSSAAEIDYWLERFEADEEGNE
jgi:predicted RNA-binding protein with PIN domain